MGMEPMTAAECRDLLHLPAVSGGVLHG